ncbi:abc transporter aclQ [Hyphodiscus hymeniophilus]|uniref:Abc transporter aclQ n=1 Tax=Hyphodiscus hymeniophilus TaxID=353542 RepID=A0A9P7AZ45_9HELO|nr:abc transporter aclQ [Hyphodiscus hymeniophilus]
MADKELLGLAIAFYLYPCGLFVTLFSSQLFHYRYRDVDEPWAAINEKKIQKTYRLYTKLIWVCQLLLSPLLLASIVLTLSAAIARRNDVPEDVNFPYTAYLASHTGVLLYFLAGLLPDPDGPWTPTTSHCSAWVVGVLIEVVIASVFMSLDHQIHVPHGLLDSLFGLSLARIVILGIMVVLLLYREYKVKAPKQGLDSERQSLLENGNGSNDYGSDGPKQKSKKPRDAQSAGWFDYFAGFRVLFPYLWPSDSHLYQVVVIICLGLMILQRAINVLVPIQLGNLVAALGYGRIPWKEIVLYVVYRSLQGQQGIIGAGRSVLWIPVSQSLLRRLSCAAFEHVLGLSMDFHLSKKIGEVTSALSRGSAMNSFLENFMFNVFPMIFDILVASVVFFIRYDAFYTLIILVIMWSYIFLTIYMAKFRGRQRRDMATKSREMEAAKTDAIIAFETVQHNCAVASETKRFEEYITVYQHAERLVQWSLNGLNVTQSTIFSLGTAMIVVLSAYKISLGQQTVSEFVTLITYFAQISAPLNFFGTFYTMIQNSLIEAERMLDLFKETSGVVEKPDAIVLPTPLGEVKFNNVKFSYQGKEPAIGGMSFTIPPGTKTAIVGESGGGKSTCLKLLFRFYDVDSGSITVDGHDIRDLTLLGLRKHIGVVPQDTVLFNATIMYNLRYARPDASEADVVNACKAANIHERILAFPDQYNTKVGERGLKLSGGERQRVAIARAILKNSRILLLDEATASLDSNTEREIQTALERVTEGRTTITIAHRLSTITNSDQIIVVHHGTVVERGTHKELLALQGRYFAMWEKQTRTEEDVTEMPTGEE